MMGWTNIVKHLVTIPGIDLQKKVSSALNKQVLKHHFQSVRLFSLQLIQGQVDFCDVSFTHWMQLK